MIISEHVALAVSHGNEVHLLAEIPIDESLSRSLRELEKHHRRSFRMQRLFVIFYASVTSGEWIRCAVNSQFIDDSNDVRFLQSLGGHISAMKVPRKATMKKLRLAFGSICYGPSVSRDHGVRSPLSIYCSDSLESGRDGVSWMNRHLPPARKSWLEWSLLPMDFAIKNRN